MGIVLAPSGAASLSPLESDMAMAVAGVLGAMSDEVALALVVSSPSQVNEATDWRAVNAAADALVPVYVRAVADEARTVAGGARTAAKGAFDAIDAAAVQWAKTKSSSLITNITAQQRASVQAIIADSVGGKMTVDQAAARIRATVGLTPQQAASVGRRGQAAHDSAYAQATAGGMPDAAAKQSALQAQKTAEAEHHQRLMRYRSKVIARTEVMQAQNQGRYQGWQTAVDEGWMSPKSRKKWVTTEGRACPKCTPWHGVVVGWNESFPNGVSMPPLHPQCRCTATALPPGRTTGQGMGGAGWESRTQVVRSNGQDVQVRSAPRFTGSRCPICPGNCALRRAIGAVVKAEGVEKAANCTGMPKSAPPNAIPITTAAELDVGDTLWLDHLKHKCYEILGPGDKPGWVKMKAPNGSVSNKKIDGSKHPHAVTPGPVKLAKQSVAPAAPVSPPAAPKPPKPPSAKVPAGGDPYLSPTAPPEAVIGHLLEDLDVGDGVWGQVVEVGPDGVSVFTQVWGTVVEVETKGLGQYMILSGDPTKKIPFYLMDFWKTLPGPGKAAKVLNQTGPAAKPPHTMGQGAVRAPGVWHPKPGYLTGHKDFKGNSYFIVEDLGGEKWKIKASSGKTFTASTADLVGLPPGVSLKVNGVEKVIVKVEGDKVTFKDGTTDSLVSLTENGTSSKATKVASPGAVKPGTTKPAAKKPAAKPSYGAAQTPTDPKDWKPSRVERADDTPAPRPTPYTLPPGAPPNPKIQTFHPLNPPKATGKPTPKPKAPEPAKPQQVTPIAPSDGTQYAPVVQRPEVILGRQIAGPSGSNTHPPSGMWEGTDGVKRYVKAYSEPEQAFSEMLSNQLYEALGLRAPKTGLSHYTYPDGSQRWLVVTEIVDNKGTVGKVGLSKKIAEEIADGTAADIWMGNFDSVGMGLDNIVVTGRGLVRIDSGGSMFFRAQGARKTDAMLSSVDMDTLFKINGDYRRVLQAAGFKDAAAFYASPKVAAQVRAIRDLVESAGGIDRIVASLWDDVAAGARRAGYPLFKKPDLDGYGRMLERRLKSFEDQVPGSRAGGAVPAAAAGSGVGRPAEKMAPAPKVRQLSAAEAPGDAGLPAAGGYTVEQAVAEAAYGDAVHVGWDAGAVENLDVAVGRGRWGGQEYVEYRYKLTANMLEHLKKEVDNGLDGWDQYDGYTLTSLHYDTGEWTRDHSVWFTDAAGVKTLRRKMDDGTVVEVAYMPTGEQSGYSFRGMVRAYVPEGKADTAKLQEVMSQTLVPREANRYAADDGSLEEFKRLRLVQVFNQWDRRLENFDLDAALARVKTQFGLSVDDLTLEFGSRGVPELMFSDNAVATLMLHTGVKNFMHDSGNFNAVVNMVATGRITSTAERFINGINVTGMSSYEDIRVGGAGYVFTRQRGRLSVRPPGTFVLDAKKLLRRSDFYSYSGDRFGARFDYDYRVQADTVQEIATKSGNCETMFKDQIDLIEYAKVIYMWSAEKTRIYEAFAEAGTPPGRIAAFEKIVKWV